VVTVISSRSDRLTEMVFLQTKATHYETMMTTVDEVNSDKTKVPDECIFRSFCLIVLLPSSMSKLIHNRWSLVVLLNLCGCIHVNKGTIGSLLFYMLLSSTLLLALKLYQDNYSPQAR